MKQKNYLSIKVYEYLLDLLQNKLELD